MPAGDRQQNPPMPATALLLLLAVPAAQEGPGPPYGLFRPVPLDRLRPLSPDRPDATESPVTVDAGHLQFEVSLADWSRDRGRERLVGLQTNAKVGLSERTDLQVLLDPFVVEDGPGGGRLRGGGDVTTRLKWNLWGNDGGDTALALLPYATFPGGGEVGGSELQGGLAVPFSTSAGDVSVGLMASFDAVYDDGADRHRLEVLHTAVAGFELAERTGAYLEYAGTAGPGDYRASVNLGLTRALSRDAVLDVGARVGLTSAAEDLGLFVGFTRRF